jgi:hypothetical protein
MRIAVNVDPQKKYTLAKARTIVTVEAEHFSCEIELASRAVMG